MKLGAFKALLNRARVEGLEMRTNIDLATFHNSIQYKG